MRSKRLRTTEEPIGLNGSSALTSSKRKGLCSPPGPKLRRIVAGKSCREEAEEAEEKEEEEQKEKEKEAELKHNQNSVLSGERR